MSEGQAEDGLGSEPVSGPSPAGRRPEVNGVTLLLAIERVGDDVASLTHLLASQPEEVAARVDVDTAAAAIGLRVNALGSSLDQLRMSLLAGLDRATDRLDQPVWLPELAHRIERSLGDRLGAIALQVDRLTPLVRAGDEVGSLLGQLDRVGVGLERILAHLEGDGIWPARTEAARRAEARAERERVEAMFDEMAGVIRRQDELAAAIAAVLDHVRGPLGVDAVFERIAQHERVLTARLDRIELELRKRRDAPPPGAAPPSAEIVSRLAELRAERARVQARLEEERLLAASPWVHEDFDDDA